MFFFLCEDEDVVLLAREEDTPVVCEYELDELELDELELDVLCIEAISLEPDISLCLIVPPKSRTIPIVNSTMRMIKIKYSTDEAPRALFNI